MCNACVANSEQSEGFAFGNVDTEVGWSVFDGGVNQIVCLMNVIVADQDE